MEDMNKQPKLLKSSIWEFLFQLVFVSHTNTVVFCCAWAIEKILLILPPLLYIFYQSHWSSFSHL